MVLEYNKLKATVASHTTNRKGYVWVSW